MQHPAPWRQRAKALKQMHMPPTPYEETRLLPKAAPFIRRVMVAEYSNPVNGEFLPAPTGLHYFGWVFSGQLQWSINGRRELASAGDLHIWGQIKYQDIRVRHVDLLGHVLIEFTATGFYELMPFSPPALTGKAMVLSGNQVLSLPRFSAMVATLPPDPTPAQRGELLQQFLLMHTEKARVAPDYVKEALACIEKGEESPGIKTLASNLGISERQLRRSFSEVTGISPTYYWRIIQMNRVVNMITTQKFDTLSELAIENGFYDQPHLAHAMRRFLNMSPSEMTRHLPNIISQFLGTPR